MDFQEIGEEGERAVNEIAFNTYLKYWCYPNPKDERDVKRKEICDLLILFKSTAVIISIKNYSFKDNYDRYFRSTLDKAVAQIEGAERKLFHINNDLYIKHPDLLEEKFEPGRYQYIYRVIVNISTMPLFYPAGRESKYGYTHIFNWDAFLTTVVELDTIPDFINYLSVRQDAFHKKDTLLMLGKEEDWDENTGKEYFQYMSRTFNPEKTFLMIDGGELDLVADYYYHEKKFNKNFYASDYSGINYDLSGNWERYLNAKEVRNKKMADRVSYFVDDFVKKEVLLKTGEDNLLIATELLALSRFERRIVGHHFFEFTAKYNSVGNSNKLIARRYGMVGDMYFGFLLHPQNLDQRIIMSLMELAINGFCYFDGFKASKMILIACSNRIMVERAVAFSFGFVDDIKPFSDDFERDLVHDLKIMGWFEKVESLSFNMLEYPNQ